MTSWNCLASGVAAGKAGVAVHRTIPPSGSRKQDVDTADEDDDDSRPDEDAGNLVTMMRETIERTVSSGVDSEDEQVDARHRTAAMVSDSRTFGCGDDADRILRPVWWAVHRVQRVRLA